MPTSSREDATSDVKSVAYFCGVLPEATIADEAGRSNKPSADLPRCLEEAGDRGFDQAHEDRHALRSGRSRAPR